MAIKSRHALFCVSNYKETIYVAYHKTEIKVYKILLINYHRCYPILHIWVGKVIDDDWTLRVVEDGSCQRGNKVVLALYCTFSTMNFPDILLTLIHLIKTKYQQLQ